MVNCGFPVFKCVLSSVLLIVVAKLFVGVPLFGAVLLVFVAVSIKGLEMFVAFFMIWNEFVLLNAICASSNFF